MINPMIYAFMTLSASRETVDVNIILDIYIYFVKYVYINFVTTTLFCIHFI